MAKEVHNHLIKVSLELYVRAIDEKMAQALANIYAYRCTEYVRRENSNWVEDKETTMVVNPKIPVIVNQQELNQARNNRVDEDLLVEVFGENRAIKFLLHE
jgi:hypothetical protein